MSNGQIWKYSFLENIIQQQHSNRQPRNSLAFHNNIIKQSSDEKYINLEKFSLKNIIQQQYSNRRISQ